MDLVAQPVPLPTNPIARMRVEARTERSLSAPLPPGETCFSVRRGMRFLEHPLELLLASYQTYGPVFSLRLLTTPTVWMIGPEANHFLLVSGTKHVRWRDGLMGDLIPLVGDGLLTTDEEAHDRARRLIQPAFSRKAVEQQVDIMVEEADRAIAGLHDSEDVDAYVWARRLALGIALRGLFGIAADEHRCDEVAERSNKRCRFTSGKCGRSCCAVPRRRSRRWSASAARCRHSCRRRSSAARRSGAAGDDILARLIRAEDAGDRLTDPEIIDQILTLLFAGHDTTTSTISFMLHELSRYPHELELLQAELYPDPEAFVPDRFASDDVAKLPKGAYVPFGGGTRICVGKRFGELEIKAIAIRLLQRFRPELQGGFRLTVRQAPTLSPRQGLRVRMHARDLT